MKEFLFGYLHQRLSLVVIFAVFVPFHLSGQSNKIDSIKTLIQETKDSPRKVALLNDLSFEQFMVDVQLADSTTRDAVALAKRINDRKGLGWATVYRGLYYSINGELAEALKYFDEARRLAIKVDDKNLETYALTQTGTVYHDRGNFDSSFLFLRKAEVLARASSDTYYNAVVQTHLARLFLETHQPDSSLMKTLDALHLREKLNDSVLIADVWILLGKCYAAKEDFVKATQYYEMARTVSRLDKIVYSDYLQNMGELDFTRGDFENALEKWAIVLRYYRNAKNKYGLAELLQRMGAAFQQQGYFELAIEYLNEALKISKSTGYRYLLGKIYLDQSWTFYRSLNFKSAFEQVLLAENQIHSLNILFDDAEIWDLRGLIERNLGRYDSSLFYHHKSVELNLAKGNRKELSDNYFNLGEFYIKASQPGMALNYYRKSISIDKALNIHYGESLDYNRMGRIFLQLENYDSAKFYFDASMKLAIPIKANDIFRDNYHDLEAFYEKTGNLKQAIFYSKKYNSLSDSIFTKQAAQSLASYRTLYDVERNESKIEILNADNELKQARLLNQRAIIYFTLAGLLILLFIAISYRRYNKNLKSLNRSLAEKNQEVLTQSGSLQTANVALGKMNREIAEQKEEIQAQAEELAESNDFLEERILSRTSELKVAYKELDTFFYRASHDFRRPLTTFMGLAEVAKLTVRDDASLSLFEKVDETARNLDKMLKKLQSISDIAMEEMEFRNINISNIVEQAIIKYRSELVHKAIEVKLEISQFEFYSYPALLLVVLENLIENALNFSRIEGAWIKISTSIVLGNMVITIEDNGQGIDDEHLPRVFEMFYRANERSKGNGLGLYIVKKTADKLGALIEVTGSVGIGTLVKLTFISK
ncbi:MAG: tetratricopeptide repeat protein [Chryseolinea sp.]